MELPIRPVLLNNIKIEPEKSNLVYKTGSIMNMSNNNTKVENKSLKKSIGNMTIYSSVPAIDLGKLLLIACRDGNLNKTYELISKGAPFASDWLGMSALHFAAQNNHLKICELLLRGGHNLDLKTKVERTPLHLAAYEGHDKVVELLCLKKADPNIKDMLRMTPLHWAIEKRHKKIVHLLLRHGANVDDISKFGKSPFDLAIQTGQNELITHLNYAKENQTEREMLITEQIENETTQAVNSITMTPDDNMICDDDEEEFIEIQNDETIEESTNEDENSTMEMLNNLKSMAQSKDNLVENDNLLSSALQNGRKLILSEGGKLALNETKKRQLSENNMNNLLNIKQEQKPQPNKIILDKSSENAKEKNNSIDFKPIINRHGKGVQVISLETFKKLYGHTTAKQLNSFRKKPTLPQLSNITKITNLNEITSNRAFFQSKNSNVQTFNIHKLKEFPELSSQEIEVMQNIIDIEADDIIEDESEFLNETENVNNDIIINEMPIMDVPSICKELYELRKLIGSLKQELDVTKQELDVTKQELDVTKQENQQHKTRIERIERLIQGD